MQGAIPGMARFSRITFSHQASGLGGAQKQRVGCQLRLTREVLAIKEPNKRNRNHCRTTPSSWHVSNVGCLKLKVRGIERSWKDMKGLSKLKCMVVFEFSGDKCVIMYLLNVPRFLGALQLCKNSEKLWPHWAHMQSRGRTTLQTCYSHNFKSNLREEFHDIAISSKNDAARK